MEMIR